VTTDGRPDFPWHYERADVIRFGYCDPAGIAYFPRLDELLNATFEDWCAAAGSPFRELMGAHRIGFPLVHATVDYHAPLRLGDAVTITQQVAVIGNASITFDLAIVRDTTRCLTARHVRVTVSMDEDRAVPLPITLRELFDTSDAEKA
jgi:4-hydroxybenzoyl-CoA thioesterase